MIKKFLGRLLGSDALVEGAFKGIDKAFYTAEEKAEDAEKARQAKSEWFIRYLESTTNSALARRILAFMLVGHFMLVTTVWLIVAMYAIYNPTEELKAVGELLWMFIEKFVTLVMLILAFYFGPQQFSKLIDAWKGSSHQSAKPPQ
jgi:hypothetical protein